MRAGVAAAHTWTVGGADASLESLPEVEGFVNVPDPGKPDAIPAGNWRRMSRIARFAAACVAPLGVAPDDTTALFFGTGAGEFSSTASFLRTFIAKGAAGASPLLFQNSVHNATPGHLSMAFGLRGPSETVCAGGMTSLRLLERALAWVTVRGRPAIVVAADDLGPDVETGWRYGGAAAPMGEGAAALLLVPEGGVPIRWEDADPLATDWQRAGPWPGEPPHRTVGRAHDRRLGLFAAVDLVAVAACVREGRGAVGWSGTRVVLG